MGRQNAAVMRDLEHFPSTQQILSVHGYICSQNSNSRPISRRFPSGILINPMERPKRSYHIYIREYGLERCGGEEYLFIILSHLV